jgi:hypothetical protein
MRFNNILKNTKKGKRDMETPSQIFSNVSTVRSVITSPVCLVL